MIAYGSPVDTPLHSNQSPFCGAERQNDTLSMGQDAIAEMPKKGTPAYMDALNESKRPTAVFSNRPAWVAPQRTHWLHAFAKSSPQLATIFGVVGTCGAAAMIINMLGGGH